MPVIAPKLSALNFTPTSPDVGSPESASALGTWVLVPQSEHGQFTVTVVPAPGVWRLPLSSTARTLTTVDGLPWAIHA
jgi:hypothetical protein